MFTFSCARSIPQPAAFKAGRAGQRGRRLAIACSAASRDEAASRRIVLGGAAAAVAAPLLLGVPAARAEANYIEKVVPVSGLSAFQRNDIVNDFIARAAGELRKVLTAADAPAAVRLLINDAATHDAAGGAGGADGSVVLPEELGRPENAGLKPLVERLAKAKAAIDAGSAARGQGSISWADTIALTAKVAVEATFAEARQAKAKTAEGKKEALRFLNPVPIRVGRVDATAPAPAGRLPAADAPAAELRAFFNALGVRPGASTDGPFGKRPPFGERAQFLLLPAAQADKEAAEEALVAADPAYAEWQKKYGAAKRALTPSEYEVDLGERLAALANLGATFDKTAYLYPLVFKVPTKF